MNVGHYKFKLPLDWQQTELNSPHRRHSLGSLHISGYAVDMLNQAMARVDDSVLPLSTDQIVSCGRQVKNDSVADLKLPLCIFERFKTLALMDAMVKDYDWQIEDMAAYRVDVVLDYLKKHDELIPYNAPVIGHLDDAILVEASQRVLQQELESYVDYRRLRKMEAALQGKEWQAFHYCRDNWLESREAEQALIQYHSQQGLSSFFSGEEVRIFKIH